MDQSLQYIKVIETVEVNGCYVEEHRCQSERRKMLKQYFNYYERRLCKHRRHSLELDIQV